MVYHIDIILTENNSIHFDVYEDLHQWPVYLGTYRHGLNIDNKLDLVSSIDEEDVINLIEKTYNI